MVTKTTHKSWIYRPNKKLPLVFVVGQNPGKSKETEKKAFTGNRTGVYVMNLLHKYDIENVYLTNVCDSEYMTEPNTLNGTMKLYSDIRKMRPKLVICMGRIAEYTVNAFEPKELLGMRINLPHPSHALRFNVETEKQQIESTFKDIKEVTK